MRGAGARGDAGPMGKTEDRLRIAGDVLLAVLLLLAEAGVLVLLLFITGIEQWADPEREPSSRVLIGTIVLAVVALVVAVALGGRRMPVAAVSQGVVVALLAVLAVVVYVEDHRDAGPAGEPERSEPERRAPPCYSGSDCSESGG